MTTILVADDDRAIRGALDRALRTSGYSVLVASDGAEALELITTRSPDACILDVTMPLLSGLDVTRSVRSNANRTPILVLTARSELDARVEGLDAGADDYLAKPFELPELLARIRALLRRAPDGAGIDQSLGVRVDPVARRAWRDERELALTRIEFDLLVVLVCASGQVLTQERLYEQVWGYDFGRKSKNLAVYITYLRQKLEMDGGARIIQSVRGVGYVLRADDTP